VTNRINDKVGLFERKFNEVVESSIIHCVCFQTVFDSICHSTGTTFRASVDLSSINAQLLLSWIKSNPIKLSRESRGECVYMALSWQIVKLSPLNEDPSTKKIRGLQLQVAYLEDQLRGSYVNYVTGAKVTGCSNEELISSGRRFGSNQRFTTSDIKTWMTIELKHPAQLNHLEIGVYDDGRTFTIEIETSEDGVKWTTLANAWKVGGQGVLDFEKRSCRWIRLQGSSTTNQNLHMTYLYLTREVRN